MRRLPGVLKNGGGDRDENNPVFHWFDFILLRLLVCFNQVASGLWDNCVVGGLNE